MRQYKAKNKQNHTTVSVPSHHGGPGAAHSRTLKF